MIINHISTLVNIIINAQSQSINIKKQLIKKLYNNINSQSDYMDN